MGIKKLANGSWRVQVRKKHVRLDKVFDTEEEAQAAHDDAMGRSTPPTTQTLSELWTRYEASMDFEAKAAHTKLTEARRIKPVLAKIGKRSLEELEANTGLIYDYIDERGRHVSNRTKRRLSTTSVRLEVAALSAVVAFAKRRQYVRANFVSNISAPADCSRAPAK